MHSSNHNALIALMFPILLVNLLVGPQSEEIIVTQSSFHQVCDPEK